jgi:hypothetical protein
MDEIEAMARAGETVGEAVGKGLRAVRIGAARATHAGAEASSRLAHRTEQRLTEQGFGNLDAQELLPKQRVVAKTKKARKALRRKRKELAKSTQRLGERLADQIQPRRKRRWPWLFALFLIAAAVTSVVRARRPEEVHLTAGEDEETSAQHVKPLRNDELADRR